MKTVLTTLAFTAALTSAALAGSPTPKAGDPPTTPGPVVLSEAQLDTVTAGAGQSGGINSGGEFSYGGGAGVDPSLYGGGAGTDPSFFGTKVGAGVEVRR